jgi:heme exporter protein D
MTHLPFIIAAYVIAIGLPIIFSVDALLRVRAARRRLDAIDPRRSRGAA